MYYFDNAATTFPKPDIVYKAMDEFYRSYGVNVGRGQFKEASIANKLVEDTRDELLELFHCNRGSKQVVFTASATEALNLVLRGIDLSEGSIVYTTPFEHNAVLRTLHYLESENGIIVKYIVPDKRTFNYDVESIKKTFEQDKPDLVMVNHASNVIGVVSPLKELFGIAKEYNAITVADMSQTAGLIDTNLLEIKCDYAVFAGHKTLYGPFGIAGIIAPLNCHLKPLLIGGTGTESANPEMPEDEPIRYEAGSPNIHAIAGLNAALKWISNIGIDNIREKEKKNKQILLSILSKFDNVKIYTYHNCETVGVISCNFDNYSSDNIGQVLSRFDIATRTGLHCAPLTHDFIETSPSGTVRFSVSYFTSKNEFNKLEEALDYIRDNS